MNLIYLISLILIISLIIIYLIYIKYITRKPKNKKDEESFLYDFSFENMSRIINFHKYGLSHLKTILYFHDRKNNLFIDTFMEIRSRVYELSQLKKKHFFDYKKFIEVDDVRKIIDKYNFLLCLQIDRFKLMKFDLDNFSNNTVKDKRLFDSYYDNLKKLMMINKYILPDFNYYYFKDNMIKLKNLSKECKVIFNKIKTTL